MPAVVRMGPGLVGAQDSANSLSFETVRTAKYELRHVKCFSIRSTEL
jgi:hypothetical protein